MKRITIIGGGISGLSVLHYLKQRFGKAVHLVLLEREAAIGGTTRTMATQVCLFETGPNGFLDNQPATLELIRELGMADQLIVANPQARRRYLQHKGRLHVFPLNPTAFVQTSLLSLGDKIALARGLFKKDISTDQSIYDYVAERFSPNIAKSLADPFITGIYAGDIKRLHMKSAFPKVGGRRKARKSCMRSFRRGMGQLIETLGERYQQHIQVRQDVGSVARVDGDAVIIATPAHVAAKLVEKANPLLSTYLERIYYSPVAVAGISVNRSLFKKKPDGLGYLVSSCEGKDILGVVVESNVYTNRAACDEMLIRVMLGGAHHPDIVNNTQGQILEKALKELNDIYGLKGRPSHTFVKLWAKGIPQYELNYPLLRKGINEALAKTNRLHLCANYLDGISFNDCITNAKKLAQTIEL